MENTKSKLKLLLCFLLGGVIGAYVIGKYYFVPKHNEYVGMEDSLKSYSSAVIYKLIKNEKFAEAAAALKKQSESLIEDKYLILSLLNNPKDIKEAVNNFERAEQLLKPPVVHVIGVYEGRYPENAKRGFGKHPDGFIDVIIEEHNEPIALILESHEPVVWYFKNYHKTKIEKVIISSPYVRGAGGLDAETNIVYERVSFFGYKKEIAYEKVEEYSLSEFGASPETLQIEYKGSEFIVSKSNKRLWRQAP